MTDFPDKFIELLGQTMPPEEVDKLLKSLNEKSPVSVRFNPYKLASKPVGIFVPWSKYGMYLNERPVFTADPLFHSGIYYPQEAASMFVEQVFLQVVGEDNERLRVLDLCAAPGGKTTHMSTLIGLDGVLVSNEVIKSRARVLVENVQKWGLGNVIVTNNDPTAFAGVNQYFDVVVIDTPCSGEGMFRKNDQAAKEWGEDNVNLCAARDKRIISDVWNSLRDGGLLIYSTCTFNRKENEDILEWIQQEFSVEPVEMNVPKEWNISVTDTNGVKGYHFYPHKTRSEGFFISVMRKGETETRSRKENHKQTRSIVMDIPRKTSDMLREWVNCGDQMSFASINERIFGYYKSVYSTVRDLEGRLNMIYSGVEMGEIIRNELKPLHTLALFHDVNLDMLPAVEVDLEDAQKYLSRKDIDPAQFEEGLNLLLYESCPIGFIKRIGNRCNNMYPKEYRILMDIE